MTKTCDGCRFWTIYDINTGRCRRRSPAGPFPFREGDHQIMVDVWPHTAANDHCGQWKAKEGLRPSPGEVADVYYKPPMARGINDDGA